MKTFEEFKDTICKKYNETCAIHLDTITTESEEKYCKSEDSDFQTSVERVIRLVGFPEFKITYFDEYKKYFLYKQAHGVPDAFLCGDPDPENILKVIESIINCGRK